jgi:hypothetical protein
LQKEPPANSNLEAAEDLRDPFDEAIGLLAAIDDNVLKSDVSTDGKPKEKSAPVTFQQTGVANGPTSPVVAATMLQSAIPIDDEGSTFARTALTTSMEKGESRDQLVAEVANGKQEWEIEDIVGKEDVDGVVHYLVEWRATLMPKYELGKAKSLVEKFEARLRAQGRQRGRKRRGRLHPSMAGKQVDVGARAAGKMQEKKRRGRPRKSLQCRQSLRSRPVT